MYSTERRILHRVARTRCVLLIAIVLLFFSVAQAAPTDTIWRLHAYHLHHHTDAEASSPATAPVLLSERDLLTDTCALDTTVTNFAAKKATTTAATTQSILLYRANFSAVSVLAHTTPGGLRMSPFRAHDSGVPESPASAAVRQRTATVVRHHTLGLVDLGTFQAESIEVPQAQTAGAATPLAELEGEDDTAVLPALTDPSDESEHTFSVNIFLGDFTRTLCLGAALYAKQADAGNVSAALAVWVPHSVSPACAMRLSPHLRTPAGLSLTEEDAVEDWPLPQRRRCRLDQGNHFTFSFTPSLAQAKRPSFCTYAPVGGTTTAPVPGTHRHMRCAVFLDVQLYTWYGATLREAEEKVAALKVAAAVTEVGSQTRTAATSTLGKLLKPARAFEADGRSPREASAPGLGNASIRDWCGAAGLALDRAAVPLAAAASPVGGISRYKGTLWCTAATVGPGFWWTDIEFCAEVVREHLSAAKGDPRQRRAFLRDCLALTVAALAVGGFSAVLTTRVAKTVRRSRRRVQALR